MTFYFTKQPTYGFVKQITKTTDNYERTDLMLSIIGIDGQEVNWDGQDMQTVTQAVEWATKEIFPKLKK